MFSLEDSEGCVEVKQDFGDDNEDFYVPQRLDKEGNFRESRGS